MGTNGGGGSGALPCHEAPIQQHRTGFSRLLSEGYFRQEARKQRGQHRPCGGPQGSGRHHDWIQYAPLRAGGKPLGPRRGSGLVGFAAAGRVCDGVVMAWIELDGAVNVRDLGDMPTEDGHKTARASLLRADSLQDLSAADVRKLVQDIGVTTVVDLRSSNELAAEGPAPLDAVAGVRHAHHPVLPEVGTATDVIVDAPLARDRMDKFRYPGDPVCGHYLGYLAARLRRSRLYSRDVNSKPADLQRPRAETMAAFLEQMDARYGGVASWLTGHGLSADDLEALRVKLRAGA